jgi:HPt (histidine-containing phosphotransfer) domain-containing protein
LKSQIEKFNPIDFDEQEALIIKKEAILKELTDMRNKRSVSETIVKDAAKLSSKAADEIEHLQDNKCPYCKQQFGDAKALIKEKQAIIDEQYGVSVEHEKILVKLAKEIQDHDDTIVSINASLQFKQLSQLHQEKAKRQTVLEEYSNKRNLVNPYASDDLNSIREELEKLENSNNRIMTAIKVLEEDVKGFKKNLEFSDLVSLQKAKMDLEQLVIDLAKEESSENPHISTLSDLEAITFDQSNIDKIKKLERLINHQTLLHKYLTRPDSFIRKAILVDKLVNLNDSLKHYLNILGMPYKVVFSEELEAKISHFGTEMDYDQMSTGQKARINIALSFAFRDVLQDRFGKINLCILDEFLDTGLSTVGVTQAVQMIKKIAQDDKLSMFVISHKDEVVNSFSNVLEVELSNGFSFVKQ